MKKSDLLFLSYPDEKETNLKNNLKGIKKEYTSDKAFNILSLNNHLLLNKCNINESNYRYILLKNYLYYIKNHKDIKRNFITEQDNNNIDLFNQYIDNNDYTNAIIMYENNNIIHELLCAAYIKNLDLSEEEKVSSIKDEDIDKYIRKLIMLIKTNLVSNIAKEDKYKKFRKLY